MNALWLILTCYNVMWCHYPHFKERKTENHGACYVLFNIKPQKYWGLGISIWKIRLEGNESQFRQRKEGKKSSQGLLSDSDSCLSSG